LLSGIFGLNEWLVGKHSAHCNFIEAIGQHYATRGGLVQKIILFLVFFLAGMGTHRLFSEKGAGAYFAGLLFMINPVCLRPIHRRTMGSTCRFSLTAFLPLARFSSFYRIGAGRM